METKNNAKFAFFYLLSLVALVFISVSTGMIIFQLINKFIQEVGASWSGVYSDSSVKFGISALLVSAPIFYYINHLIYKSLFTGELDKEAGVRRWLTYFILFVSSVVIIGWLINIINNFLEGEITLKFILKAITVLMIAASIFGFYVYDIRRKEVSGIKSKVNMIYFISSLAIVTAAFISAFFVVESPVEAKNKRLDQNLLNNFNNIDSCINEYYSKELALPENLQKAEEKCNFLLKDNLKNPHNGNTIEYKITGEKTYELCADFKTSNINNDENDPYRMDWQVKSQMHESGWQCIGREVTYYGSMPSKEGVPIETIE